MTQKEKMCDPEEWFLQVSECGKFVIEYSSPITSILEYLSAQQHDTVILFWHLPATSHRGVGPRIKKSYGTQEMIPPGFSQPN